VIQAEVDAHLSTCRLNLQGDDLCSLWIMSVTTLTVGASRDRGYEVSIGQWVELEMC